MKKYYYIFSKVLLFISTIYLISGILDLTSISKKMIIYIFILNMTLELIRFIIFKENSNYEKKTIPSSIIYLNTIFFVLAIYFDVIYLKIIAIVLFSILIIIKIKDEYLTWIIHDDLKLIFKSSN